MCVCGLTAVETLPFQQKLVPELLSLGKLVIFAFFTKSEKGFALLRAAEAPSPHRKCHHSSYLWNIF